MNAPLLAENPACNPKCGACHYKTLTYGAQLERKNSWAQEQLATWSSVLHPILPAPENERLAYRSKSWLRSHVENGQAHLGMFRSKKDNGKWRPEFISWDTCPLHVLGLQEVIRRVAPLLPIDEAFEGIWAGAPHLVFISRSAESLEELAAIDWAKILVPPFDQVWKHVNPQVGRRIFSHHPITPIHGQSAHLGSQAHPIRAFRQVTQTLLLDARHQAVEALLEPRPAQIVDLYCGTGELSLLLPETTFWLGIELSGAAVEFANGLRPSAIQKAFVGTVEHRVADPAVRTHIDTNYSLYLNPPRTGLMPEAHTQLAALFAEKRPKRIAYLSCSASSLARDLRFLEAQDYAVTTLQPFDFFPQTEHFETLAILK